MSEVPAQVVSILEKRVERLFDGATPEQWLKWAVVCHSMPTEMIGECLRMGMDIDDMFTRLAEAMYPPEEAEN